MGVETEVKFAMRSAAFARRLLKKAGARRLGKVSEHNECFDLPGGVLKKRKMLLRLRRDGRVRVTLKLKPGSDRRFKVRTEIEFEASDFAEARRFFEALGFRKWYVYEKKRESWLLAGCRIEVDELYFGAFIELEGSKAAIRKACARLGLKLSEGLTYSYFSLERKSKC